MWQPVCRGALAGGGAPKSHQYGRVPEPWPLWYPVPDQDFGRKQVQSRARMLLGAKVELPVEPGQEAGRVVGVVLTAHPSKAGGDDVSPA